MNKSLIVGLAVISAVLLVSATYASAVTIYNEWSAETPQSYLVFVDDGVYYAKNGNTGAIDHSGADAESIIESALGDLTAGRTTKEKVTLKGNFTIDGNIAIPSYTILEIDGKLTRSGTGFHLLSASSVTDIEIRGGIIQSATKAVEAYDTNEIDFNSVTNGLIQGVTINDAAEDAIRIRGASSNIKVLDNSFYSPNRHAIDINGATTHNIIVANNYVNETLVYDAITVFVSGGHSITIEGNTLENIDGSAASSSAIHVEDTVPSNLNNIVVDGNSIYNSQFGITVASARPVVITDNVIRDTVRGIQLQNPVLSVISGNIIDNSEQTTTSYGIYLYGITASTISNNIIRGAATNSLVYGIYWDESGAFTENTISGNVISRTLDGIRYAGSRNIFDANQIRFSEQMAIRIQDGSQNNIYSNNFFYNNGQDGDNTYFDINMEASSGANTIGQWIIDNNFLSDGSINVARHINFTSPSDVSSLVVMGNRFVGAQTAVFSATLPTSGVTIVFNRGYTTESEGTGTIDSGTTSEVISHSLSYTPSAAECSVIFTENPTNDPGATFITSITSAQLTVNVENDPGASNLDFSWSCRRI